MKSGLRSRFCIGMECASRQRGKGKWNGKAAIGDGVQVLCREALCPEYSFSRNGAAMYPMVKTRIYNRFFLLMEIYS